MSTDGCSTRVLWLTPDKPENISVGRRRISECLERRGYDVTLRGTTPRTLFTALTARGRYDVVIGTTRAGAIAGTLLAVAGGPPLVVDHVDPIRQFATTHPRWLAFVVRWLEHLAFAVSAHTLYVYPEEASRVGRFATLSKTDLGVAYDRFADPSTDIIEAARTRLARLDLNERVLVYVGGLEPIYHVEELLDAMCVLDEWSLLVLGTGSLEGMVRNAAATLDNVEYLGTVPHEAVPGYLHAADVGVSLVDDPHTLKVLEYGAAGVPVVQLAGRAEQRFDGLVEFCEPTPDDIAQAVRRAERGRTTEALKTFAQRFAFESVADDYERAIDLTTER